MGTREISALLAFWTEEYFVLKDWCVHCEMFSSITGLCALHAG